MSQRDDELIQLLRAELTRRATMTPREGFDMRVHTTVRELQRPPHRGLQGLFRAGAATAAVAAVAVALALGLRAHQNHGSAPAAPVPTPSPARAQQSGGLMVFQAEASAGHFTTTLMRGDGEVVKTVDAPAATRQTTLSGRAIYLDDGHQGWVLHRDGSITGVNPAARADLAAATNGLVMIDDHTAVASVPVGSGDGVRLEVIDVLTGARRVAIDAKTAPDASPSSGSDVGIAGVSRDWSTVYVLVRDMVVNGRLISDPVVEDVDVALAKVIRSRPLPVGTSPVAISPDGRLVAWQDSAVDNAKHLAYFVTHLTDLKTGKTVDVTGTGIGVGGVFPGMIFSPDGTRLVLAGNDNEATPTGIESMVEVSTADGRVLQRQQNPSQFSGMLNPVGWLDADHLGYQLNTTVSQNGRSVGDEEAHVIDLSGSRPPLSRGGLGTFIAVLR